MADAHTWVIAGGRELDLSQPVVMAVLNVTPDSFSDGRGELPTTQAVLDRAAAAIADGAALLDVGGESTRPGAERIDADEQIRRVIPAVRALAARWPDVPISIDTTVARVAEAAVAAGAAIVNDVSGGREDPAMLRTIATLGVGCILMHRERPPDQDRYSDRYSDGNNAPPVAGDIVEHVRAELHRIDRAAGAAGVDRLAVVLDPGLGFGKTVEQNLELIRRTGELRLLGRPILSGASRKSFLGRAGLERDSDPSERLGASVAATVLHYRTGARLFRVHDVAAHAQALRLAHQLGPSTPENP
ncbi:MAG: dihydropteroate synthase [Planctomycetota bacterium]